MRTVTLALAALLAACAPPREERPASPQQTLQPVAPPAMQGAEPAFQERVRAQFASLEAARAHGASSAEVGAAFGAVGRLLVASEFYVDAEPFLVNAHALAPSELAWPYYLGHALRLRNERDRAISQFEAALAIRPDYLPALVWLGALQLDRGDAKAAEPLFAKAVSLQRDSAAARSGLGRTALALKDLPRAREQLEAAVAADPQATTVHYALAMTYRAMGDVVRAEAELQRWKTGTRSPGDSLRDGQVPPADPLMEQVGALLDTAIAYEVRGTQALDQGKWAEAAALFRQGLGVAPSDATLHQNLGNALFLSGNQHAADAEFTEALRLAPGYARAHFSLGVLRETEGRDADAIARFADAVAYDPDLTDARFSLADALRRTGRVADALPHYLHIIQSDVTASQARFGYAMGLVRLGRHGEARAALEEAVKVDPASVGFTHALARLLAASPDDRVRDGARALTIAASLERRYGATPALMETQAMALAEVGRFAEAATRQGQAITAATQARADGVARMRERLLAYEARMPSRSPWADDDPVHRPRASRHAQAP